MCYTAIPGECSRTLAVRDLPPVVVGPVGETTAQVKLTKAGQSSVLASQTVCILSGRRIPSSPGWLFWENSRRFYRAEHRGRAARKRMHKPNWHDGYVKY